MRVGLDILMEDARRLDHLRARRVGLLAHPASVTRELVHALDALRACEVKPRVLFGPEHGYGGGAQDMATVGDDRDPSGARVVSLYGTSFDRLSPTREELAEIDTLVIDLQDVGSRYYTFTWTALLALRACAAAGVEVLLLDRPNPIDGRTIEGATHREPRLRSFVGLEPVPIRHGKSLGEIVRERATIEGIDAGLEVVALEGWDRTRYGDMWDRPFVMPSPNMPTVETAIVYPGGCLIEATNLSEGRGTTRPFEICGAPWIDGARLAADLHATGLAGFRARPIVFEPTFQKHARVACGGVQVHVTDRLKFKPVATYLALLTGARAQRPERFGLRTEAYEYVDPKDAEALDLLCGTVATREALLSGAAWRDVVATVCA
ncbi:MAG: exo-beta-N-acetylmuramidase NamZ domain-containing protein [Polyangiales bacterium]